MGFVYENNLTHQSEAVKSVLAVFENSQIILPNEKAKNPVLKVENLEQNLQNIQRQNQIGKKFKGSNVIDIAMETGTGKTYILTQN